MFLNSYNESANNEKMSGGLYDRSIKEFRLVH